MNLKRTVTFAAAALLSFVSFAQQREEPDFYELAEKENIETVDALIKAYNSFISAKIDDYNSSVYYENPSYIFACYEENRMI